MSDIRDRINELKSALKWTENSIAGGDAAFQKRLNRQFGHGAEIKLESVSLILEKFPQVSPDWLLFGKGDMFRHDGETSSPSDALPLIPFEAVAGPGQPIYEDERIGEYYYVSEFKECDFLIRVKGDSMAPHFTGGDLLACKKVEDIYFLQWNRAYVIYTRSQGCMVKRVQPSEKDGYIKCVSDNARYAPFDVPMDDIVSVALVNGSISLE